MTSFHSTTMAAPSTSGGAIQSSSGHFSIGGVPDFSYTQDFVSALNKTVSISAATGGTVVHIAATLVGVMGQAAPVANIFKTYKINSIELDVFFCGVNISLLNNPPATGLYTILAPFSRTQRSGTTYQSIAVNALPGAQVKYFQGWPNTTQDYGSAGNQPQMVTAINANPLYQLAAFSSSSETIGGQCFTSNPLTLQSEFGDDNVEWNCFIMDVGLFKPAINETVVNFRFLYKTSVTFEGLKWSPTNWTMGRDMLQYHRTQDIPCILGKDLEQAEEDAPEQ